ncbi:YibE/F family protein [Aminipila butyrica]|uniref:YibE/F family protein n=1 Tax=Aminipila butyrica TaxID=433296 RepID=A0A858BS99_9FIRM|nr:YibE/F family protein [Aminipila butyrica]QIB68783.1 YibE/F family protein [Aminipila butyrica]
MKKLFTRQGVTFIAVILLSILFITLGANLSKAQLLTSSDQFYRARVLGLEDVQVKEISLDDGESSISSKSVFFKAEFTNGPDKGKAVTMLQYIDYMYAVQPDTVSKGDSIVVSYTADPTNSQKIWMFIDYNRIHYMVFICLAFFALIILIGRSKGLATIISLIFTAGAVFLVYIPGILGGQNIYLSTIVISIFIILMSLCVLNGVNIKTFCAVLGNMGGLAVAGILALLTNQLLGITGIVDEDCLFLMYVNSQHPLDLRAIVWGSIVIGSLGAVMDVAMSIASAMNELAETMEHRTVKRMIRSGMNIGKDAIGTMTNTLILAYIGGSLATVLLLVASNKDPLYLFNMEMIVVEVLQGIIGSTGILFAVPVTVIIAAYLYDNRAKDGEKNQQIPVDNPAVEPAGASAEDQGGKSVKTD